MTPGGCKVCTCGVLACACEQGLSAANAGSGAGRSWRASLSCMFALHPFALLSARVPQQNSPPPAPLRLQVTLTFLSCALSWLLYPRAISRRPLRSLLQVRGGAAAAPLLATHPPATHLPRTHPPTCHPPTCCHLPPTSRRLPLPPPATTAVRLDRGGPAAADGSAARRGAARLHGGGAAAAGRGAHVLLRDGPEAHVLVRGWSGRGESWGLHVCVCMCVCVCMWVRGCVRVCVGKAVRKPAQRVYAQE